MKINAITSTIIAIIDIQFFAHDASDRNVQTTGQTGSGKDMSATMKTFFDTTLLENARDQHIFEQFTEKTRIKGNKVEWRKFNTFGNAEKLTEGVIPDGKNFGMTNIEAEVNQFGMYTTISDRLEAESYDNVVFGASEEMGASMGNTQDTLTRDVFLTGQNSLFAGDATTRGELGKDDKITCQLILKAKTWLVKHKAPLIDGLYNVIVHPSVAEDLIQDPEWKEFHKYSDTDPWKKGKIGEIYGCRIIETDKAPVIKAGAGGIAVYPCIAFGAKAVGTVASEGEDFRMIVKPASEIGGPLEQYSTIGYKGVHGGRVLYEDRLLLVECASSYSELDPANYTE